MNIKILPLSLLSILSLIVTPCSALNNISPSFNCAKSSTVIERAICASQDLALSDLIMNDLYQSSKNRTDFANIKKAQRLWIKKRNKWCNENKRLSSNIAALELCYRERIRELAGGNSKNTTAISQLIPKYKKFLLDHKLVKNKHSSNDVHIKFVNDLSLTSYVIHLLGDCNESSTNIEFWDGERLSVKTYSNAIECTGRSVHHVPYTTNYCLKGDEFIQTDNFFSCTNNYSDQEVVDLASRYLTENISTIAGKAKTKKMLLYNLLNIVRNTKNPYLTDERLYSKTAMRFVSDNANIIARTAKDYQSPIIEVLENIALIYGRIRNTENWESKIKYHEHHVPTRYLDTRYNELSANFSPLSMDLEETIAPQEIIYSYKELYFRFWAKTIKSNSMSEAKRAIDTLLIAFKKAQ